jgi:hypothetical protein
MVEKMLIFILMLFIFSTKLKIRHLWKVKRVTFLHRCLNCAVHDAFVNIYKTSVYEKLEKTPKIIEEKTNIYDTKA